GGRRVRAKQHVRTKPEYTASPQPGTRIERPVVVGGRGTPSEPPPPSLAWTIPSVMHPHGRSVDDPWLERRARPPVQGPEAPEVTAESTARLRAPQGEPPAPSTAREAVRHGEAREPEAPEVREAPAST